MNSLLRKILIFILLSWIFLFIGPIFAQEKKPEIILENGFFYCVQPNGEKVGIVREHEPWAMNKAKLSPDGNYIIYTTANALGFEMRGRDLFRCKADGSERTFLHKFQHCPTDWVWVTKNQRDFLLLILGYDAVTPSGTYVLDLENGKILLSFPDCSVQKIEGKECFNINAQHPMEGFVRKEKTWEKELCVDEFANLTEPDSSNLQVFITWAGDYIYLSTERFSILGHQEILNNFAYINRSLTPEERKLYQAVLDTPATRFVYFSEPSLSLDKKSVSFLVNGVKARFNLTNRRIEILDVGGELSVKALWSPNRRYFAFMKRDISGTLKISIFGMIGESPFTYAKPIEFAPDVTISNLEWSKDEEKLYYSLEQGGVKKDSLFIDLTKIDLR